MLSYATLSDQQLASLLRDGDRAAYTEIYHRYKALLYIFAYKRIGQREEARDTIHELFLSLWTKHDTIEITTGLAPYLYTAVRNRIIDGISRQKNASRYLDSVQEYVDTANNTTDHLARHNQLLALIEREIEALPPKMRQVFEMSRNTTLSRKEIAAELSLSEETVKSHMHHALKTLKSKLGPLFIMLFILH